MKLHPSTALSILRLTSRREHLKRHAPRCLKCRNRQVQLRDWLRSMPRWKCRVCRAKFFYEPLHLA